MGIRIAAASLPDQLFFDGEGKKAAKSSLYRQFRRSDLAKGLAMIVAGLLIFLVPEGFLFILVGQLFAYQFLCNVNGQVGDFVFDVGHRLHLFEIDGFLGLLDECYSFVIGFDFGIFIHLFTDFAGVG